MGDKEIVEVVETKGVPESLGGSARLTSRSLKVGFSSEEKVEGEAQWVRQQRKAFMRWCNAFLIQRQLVLNDLEEDLSSGVLLCNLLELLAGKKLPNFTKAPKMKVQKVLNSQVALDWITKTEKLKLVGIGPEDIYDKKTKLILGLIWTLILRFQIQVGKWTVAGKKTTAKQEMLEWVNAALADYNVEVNDFSNGWKDGVAFTGLTNYLLRQKGVAPIDLKSAPLDTIDQAFGVAAKEFNIPKLLDASDMDEPDELSVMTYVSYFRQNDKLSPEELLARREVGGSSSAAPAPSTTTTTVRAVKTVAAEGEGLARAVCGEVSHFSCVTKDDKGEVYYSADTVFYGTLELPPHKKVANFENKQSGIYIGSYTLEVAGTYELVILYNDKPISSKPFRVVAEPGAIWAPVCYADGKGLNFTRSGDSSHFRVLTFDRFSNALTKGGNKVAVRFDGPEKIDGHVKDEANGTYQVDYVITKSGIFKIFITCNGEPIKGSPFELNVEAGEPLAQYVIAEGEGLHRVIAGEIAKFFVHVRDKHGNPSVKYAEARSLRARLAGPSELDCNVEDQANGSYTVTYEATVSGQHKLFVHWNDQDTVGSPFDITVLPGPVHAAKSSAEGEGLSEVVCGNEGKFLIITRDAYKNRVTTGGAAIDVSLALEGSKAIAGNVKSNEDGTYVIYYTLSIAGYYKLLITIGGKQLHGSPFQVLAKPGPFDAGSTTLEGQLIGLPAGEIIYLIIRPRDKFGNLTTSFDVADVQAALEGAGEKLECAVKHNLSEGTLSLSAKPTHPGEYKLSITFGGKAIRGSPYTLSVLAGKVSAIHSVAEGEGLHTALSGHKATFKIITKDEKGAFVNLGGAKVGGYLEGPEKVTFAEVVDHKDGTYTVHYIPVAAGKSNLNVTIDGYGIEGSPFAVAVAAGAASAKGTVAYGAGVAEAVAGEAAHYTVEVRDQNSNLVVDAAAKLTASLSGPSKVASTLANNNDGTYSGEYKADVAGAYHLELNLNGEHISESPFSVQVLPGAVSHGHTHLEGKGLSEAVAGERAKFTVLPKDALGNVVLSSALVASLGGAPADAVAVTPKADGYDVDYAVTKSGPYKLNVSLGGTPVKGSPFNVQVHPAHAHADNFLVEGKGLASAVGGEKTHFSVRAKDKFGNDITTGGAKVEAELVRVVFKKDQASGASPAHSRKGGELGAGAGGLLGLARKELETQGAPIPATVTDNGDGTYTGEYVLSASGDYALNVRANGTLLKGSPFSVTVEAGTVDLSNTLVTGDALTRKLTAGDEIQLQILPQDKLGNAVALDSEHPLSVNVEGPEPAAFTLKPNAEGAIQLAGKLNKPGKYNIAITIAGKPIKGSPFEVNVEAGKISAKNTFAEGEGLTSAVAGTPAHITVRALDDKGNALTTGGATIAASLVGPEELSAAIVDNNNGTYSLTYNPKLAGNYVLSIKSEGLPIKNSPFSLSVNPGESDAASSVAFGQGLIEGPAGKPAKFTVQAKDHFGNNLKTGGHKVDAKLAGPEELAAEVADNKDGSYHAQYVAKKSGTYTVHVSVDGKPVKDSPFQAEITSGVADATHTTAEGKGLSQTTANEATYFTVATKDALGNLVKVGGANVQAALRSAAPPKDTASSASAGASASAHAGGIGGALGAGLKLGGALGAGLGGSVKVGAGGISADVHAGASVGSGHVGGDLHLGAGAGGVGAGAHADLGLGHGSQPINITDNHDGTYSADFTVGVAGDYILDILLNGAPVKDSPFKLQVEAGAASTSNTTAQGEGLVSATSGHQTGFVVVTRDAKGNLVGKGGNTVSASLKGPETIEGTVHDKGDGTYEVHYTPALAGNYSLRVKVDKQHIKDSPFKVPVAPGALSAAKSVAIGDSITKATAGIAEKFLIQARDAAGNNLKTGGAHFAASLEGEGVKTALPVVDNGDGTYAVEYTPSKSGQQALSVLLGGEPIKDSPFNVSIAAGAISPANCTLEGEGLANAVAGEPEHFTLVLKDKFGNRLKSAGAAAVALAAKVEDASECEIYDNNDGTYRVQYRITKTGPKTVHFFVDGQPVSGLPFTVDVEPAVASPTHAYAFGEGLKTAKAGHDATYTVQVADVFDNNLRKGGHHITATLEGPSKFAGKVTDNKDGTYTVDYNTNVAGAYKIRTAFESGGEIKNSPHSLEVLAGEAAGENFTFDDIAPSPAGVAGEPVKIHLSARDAFGNKCAHAPAGGAVDATITLDGVEEPLVLKDAGHGVFAAEYLPAKSGVYSLSARVGGVPTKGSPFRYEVKPGEVSLHDTKLDLPEHIIAGEPAVFVIRPKDKHGNVVFSPVDVAAFVIDADGKRHPITVSPSTERGAYNFEFQPTKSGKFKFEILANGHPLGSVPELSAAAAHALPEHTKVTFGEGLSSAIAPATAKAGKPAHFEVKFEDQFGNVATPAESAVKALLRPAATRAELASGSSGGRPRSASLTRQGSARNLSATNLQAATRTVVKSDTLAPVETALKVLQSGSFAGELVPKVAGRYFLDLTLDGQPVKDSPFEINVEPGAISPAHALLEGAALLQGAGSPAGEPIRLTLVLRDEAGNKIIDPAAAAGVVVDASIEPEAGAVGEKVTPEVVANPDGTFSLEFKINGVGRHKLGVRVNGTPIEGGPFSVAIAAGSVNPASSTASGPGLHAANAGEVALFEVLAKDKGGNRLLSGGNGVVSFLQGPDQVDVAIHDNNDGSYSAKYSVRTVGDYKLHVVIEGKPISESPFAVSVKAGTPNAEASDVKGNFDFKCGKPEVFHIHLRDGAGNPAKTGGAKIVAFLIPEGGAALGAGAHAGAGAGLGAHAGAGVGAGAGAGLGAGAGAGVGAHAGAGAHAGLGVGAGLAAAAGLGAGAHAGGSLGVHVGGLGVDVGAGVGVGAGAGGPGAGAGAHAGVGLGAGLHAEKGAHGAHVGAGAELGAGAGTGVGSGSAESIPVDVVDNGDGTYTVSVPALKHSGKHVFGLSLDNHNFKGSPFHVDVQPGAARKVTFTAEELNPEGVVLPVAGNNYSLQLQLSDEFGNVIRKGGRDVEFKLEGPAKLTCKVADNDDGTYTVPYKLNVAGRYSAHISVDGHSLPNVLKFEVKANEISSAHTIAVGNGIKKAKAGEEATFLVQSIDKFGNEIQIGGAEVVVYLRGPDSGDVESSQVAAAVVDNGDGIYHVSYTVETAGRYQLFVNANGSAIAQSPFSVRVASGYAVAAKSVVKNSTELPAGKARAGAPAFKMHLRDKNGNFKTKGGDEIHAYLKRPTRKPARIIDNKDGTYDVIYPKGLEIGEYEVVAELKGERIEIPTPTVQVEEPSPLAEEEETLVQSLFPSASSVIANLLRNLDDAQKATLLADLQGLKK